MAECRYFISYPRAETILPSLTRSLPCAANYYGSSSQCGRPSYAIRTNADGCSDAFPPHTFERITLVNVSAGASQGLIMLEGDLPSLRNEGDCGG